MKNRALFLDRDGVINIDYGYVYQIGNFRFIDGVKETLKEFQKRGYLLIVVTNQSGIGRGYYSLKDFLTLNAFMLEELKKEGIIIAQTFFCPHHPNQKCECRKPKPKMLQKAIQKFDINPSESIMVGDKISDILAGESAGIGKNFLIGRDIKTLEELIKVSDV